MERAVYPEIAKIDSNGFERITDEELQGRTETILENISERGN